MHTQDGPTMTLTEDQYQAVLREVVTWKISFDARTSKTRALTYTSFIASPTMSCLSHEWQKPSSVRTLLECEGNDNYQNLKENSMPLWKEIQDIYDKKRSICANIRGRVSKVNLELTFPADMSSHWSLFDCKDAKGYVKEHSEVCHRCRCKYAELPVVFDLHAVQPEDTLGGVADRYGVDIAELKVINVGCDETFMSKFHLLRGQEDVRTVTNEYRPTIFENVPAGRVTTLFERPNDPILEVLGKPEGTTIRVHKIWCMDKDIPDSALLKVKHLACPFCMEHATQRVTEFLMNIIQVCASNSQPCRGIWVKNVIISRE